MLVIKIFEIKPGSETESTLVQEVQIPSAHAPALRSAVAEIQDELAERSRGSFRSYREAAITRALSAVTAFAAGLNKVVKKEDPDYA